MDNPVVTIKQGKLKGTTGTDRHGGTFFSFFGIPYAKPPLGELRFKAPQPPEPWEGIRDATQEGSECISKHMITYQTIGSEDCLILNVFTNDFPENQNKLKPVMFWIHGGGFTTGSSKVEMYGPEYIMAEDVVFVSINYRLGALGFLSLHDQSLGVPGNAGLKDMVMALKWVQENIRAFNGDPNNVTIFGESAGGAAVHYLMLSPMAKNLFHKAIAQSGCALNLWAYGSKGGDALAKNLGCDSTSEKDMLEVLLKATKEELLEAQMKLPDPFCANQVRPLGPVVEKFNAFEDAFLPDTPLNLMTSGSYTKVPFMTGYTTREGILFEILRKKRGDAIQTISAESTVPNTLRLPEKTPMSIKVGNKIKEFYFGNAEAKENTDQYYKLQTDTFFLRGIYSTIKNMLPTNKKPIYLYRFSVDGDLNIFKKVTQTDVQGVCHADELGYLFKTMISPELRPKTIEEATVTRFTKYWANFAKYGNPNPKEKDSMFPVTWEPVTQESINFVDIGENLTVGVDPEDERMKFWDEVYCINPATSKL